MRDASKEYYLNLWNTCQIRPDKLAEVKTRATFILLNKPAYLAVSKETNVPWYVIAVIHSRESDCNFHCNLANGDPLTARTIHVPIGRPRLGTPPFTWEFAAIDVLKYEGLNNISDWEISRTLSRLEAYNGQGYLKHNVNTPYLWSFTNHYGTPPNTGLYVEDHIFHSDKLDDQIGCAALLKLLIP